MASLFRIPPPMDDRSRARCDAMIQQTERACSEMLLAPDWTLNMQIVDDLNREQDPVVLAEVIRIVRKRLGSPNVRVLSVSLTLAETLVKNCGAPVHREVASERFMAAMAKIARTYSFKTARDSTIIADQVLDIIQGWGEAFLPRRREFPLFIDTYHELRAEGLPFSEQYQSDRPPVLDPGGGSLLDRPSSFKAARQSATRTPGARGGGGGGAGSSSSGLRGGNTRGTSGGGAASRGGGAGPSSDAAGHLQDLSVSEREIVSTGASCAEMLEQVLKAADSKAEVTTSDITAEIVEQLKLTAPKIANLIESNGEGDAAMLDALFKVNDAVGSALKLYRGVVDGLVDVPIGAPSRFSSDIGAISAGVGGMSIQQAASVKAAAAKLRKKSVPTLSGPPSDRKGAQATSSSSVKKPAPGGAGRAASDDPLDLLSGFEFAGASHEAANATARANAATAAARAESTSTSGADMFASFATPAAGAAVPASPAEPAGGGAPPVHGSASGGFGNGGFAVEFDSQQPQAQIVRQETAGPPTAADKAKNLLDNLGALYAGGSAGGSAGGGGQTYAEMTGYAPGLSGGGIVPSGGMGIANPSSDVRAAPVAATEYIQSSPGGLGLALTGGTPAVSMNAQQQGSLFNALDPIPQPSQDYIQQPQQPQRMLQQPQQQGEDQPRYWGQQSDPSGYSAGPQGVMQGNTQPPLQGPPQQQQQQNQPVMPGYQQSQFAGQGFAQAQAGAEGFEQPQVVGVQGFQQTQTAAQGFSQPQPGGPNLQQQFGV